MRSRGLATVRCCMYVENADFYGHGLLMVLRIPYVRALNDEKGPTRRLKPTKRARRGVTCDDSKVFWFRLCEKNKSAKPSIDILFIVVRLTIFVWFVLLVSCYWRCLSGFSPFCGHLAMCFAPIAPCVTVDR